MINDETERELPARHDELTRRLTLLARDADLGPTQQELARAWRDRLDEVRQRAEAPLSIAFMAQVGRGKSTLIAAVAGLRLDVPGSPKMWSVLPVGDGRTTLGETQIRFEARDDILLEVEPISRAELTIELRLFARDLWKDAHDERSSSTGSVGEELYGLLRAWLVPDQDNRRAALAGLAREAADADALLETLRSRLDLDQRIAPFESTYSNDQDGLCALKTALRQLMRGELANGPAPRIVRLHLPAGELGQTVSGLIDTRGIDSHAPELSIAGRPDIRKRMTDPDTLFVVCSEFESAPDTVSRKIIEALGKQEIREARSWRLLIVDRRELDDDDDPDEQAQRRRERDERVAVCHDQLRRDDQAVAEGSIVAIDARHEAEVLRSTLIGMAADERRRRLSDWAQTYDDASEAIASLQEIEFAAQARELDLQLRWIWDTARVQDERRRPDPLEALAETIWVPGMGVEHWTHLYAATRRRGRYDKLDLVALGARFAANAAVVQRWAACWRMLAFNEASKSSLPPPLVKHLRLRLRQYLFAVDELHEQLHNQWEQVLGDYFASPRTDELWSWCEARWGQGSGYMQDVASRFREESERAQLRLSDELAPRPLEDQLPQRPDLLSVRKISLRNFRGIDQSELSINETTTVLVGDNGLGKTCWLEAIAAALGVLLPGIGAGPAPSLGEGDIRQTVRMLNGVAESQYQVPMSIEIEATLQGRALGWRRVIDSAPNGDRVREVPTGEDDALQVKAREIAEELRGHGERQLPILAYYGTQRLWPPNIVADDTRQVGNRLDGYRDCLQAASTHQHMLEWVRKYTMVEIQRKEPVTQLRAIEQAVVDCVAEAEHFGYDLALEDLVLRTTSGEILPFRKLSDGYRNVVAMVADIAWRASRLNPQLGARAPEFAEGVVLIDEIDLHLHPRWQRRVLGDLRRAFPRLQFVATTHSPFIIQSLEAGQLVNLDPDARDVPYANRSPEDITEQVMGVELPQRSERRQREAEVAERYYTLLDQMPDADEAELSLTRTPNSGLTKEQVLGATDTRYQERRRAWQKAREARADLGELDTPLTRRRIIAEAKDVGFWSVWMTVFRDDAQMQAELRDPSNFPGTADERLLPLPRHACATTPS